MDNRKSSQEGALPYLQEKVGKLIAIGGEHVVKHYGDNQVIKFPFGPRYFLDRHKHCENVARDEAVARNYFKDYLIQRDVHFFPHKGRPSYVIIEPFVTGKHLRREDLQDSEIKKQFVEIVELNKHMFEMEDLAFDMFGIWGLLWRGKREVANMILNSETKKLVVIDPSVMHIGKHRDQQILVSSVTFWALKKQKKLLKHYLGK